MSYERQRIEHAIEQTIERALKPLLERIHAMATTIEALRAQVASNTDATKSATALITSLHQRLAEAIQAAKQNGSLDQLDALASDLKANTDALASAVTANTDAAPTPAG